MSTKKPLGSVVLSRDGKTEGFATGARYRCQMDGCGDLRVVVKWPDGTITRPCRKGMRIVGTKLQIV